MDAIRDAVAKALYPNGVPSGVARPASAAGGPTRVYVGWPSGDLDADLTAGITHVTVWMRGTGSPIAPYLDGWEEMPVPTPSLTVAVAGSSVTFSGDATVPRMVAVIKVDAKDTFTHAVQPNDTPQSVAAALSALISTLYPVTTDGAVVTVGNNPVDGWVVAGGTVTRESRRQRNGVVVAIWAPTQALRDNTAMLLDQTFEDSRTLLAGDGTKVTLSYDGTDIDEAGRKHPLRRRDLFLTAEYSTRRSQEAEPIVDAPSGLTMRPPGSTLVEC